MPELKRFGVAEALLLILVLVVAGGVRAGFLLVCADGGTNDGPLRVQDVRPILNELPPGTQFRGKSEPTELDALVHNVKEHHWFGSLAPFAPKEELTAHVSPGYPWTLGFLARGLGDQADRTLRWIQCGLGALTAGFYYLFARRAFRSTTVAVLTGLACALYPLWIVNTATLDDGVLTSFLLAAALFLGTFACQTGGAFASLLYGLSLAGLSLVRAALLPFAFVALSWFLLRTRSVPRGWLCALLAFLGFANGLAPWTVRNLQQLKEPMPIVDSVYWHLWIGNNREATGGPLTDRMLHTAPAHELSEIESQPRRFNRLGPEVVDELRRDPGAALQRRLWAGLCFWFGERFLTDKRLADETHQGALPEWLTALPAVLLGSLLALLVLALFGWRWTYGWRRETMLAVLAVIWVPLPYVLGHAEALQGPRLPLDGVLLCFAAFTLACLLPGGRRLLDGPKAEEAGAPTAQ